MNHSTTRRQALKSSLAWAGASLITTSARSQQSQSANDRPRIAIVGTGSRWSQQATGVNSNYGCGQQMKEYADYTTVCDADSDRMGRAREIAKAWSGKEVSVAADYRAVIDDPKIDIVHVSTPDHWHAKIAIEAMLAGKDVYCEKPMTLTIAEGILMSKVCRETKRVCQIGTQQRSNQNFLKAIALIQEGRIGDVRKATCSIGGAPTSPALPVADVPGSLNWNQWQGPATEKPFRYLAGNNGETKSWSRCHYEFRWWYEYSGGKLTDWGAHHCDIATWGLGKTKTGPVAVNPLMVKHPVEFKDGVPVDESMYNTATAFQILSTFEDGKQIELRHDGNNGILFEGTKGRIFVNRGRLTGKPVEDLASNPLPAGALERVYGDRPLTNHFQNFISSCQERRDPISDVHSHHRALTTCHLSGIAARLGREIQWNPKSETVMGDQQAQSMVDRPKRKGFDIEV